MICSTLLKQVGNLPAEADSFFSANTQTVQQQQEAAIASAVFQRQRPFQEIVSEVQGNFNFLQESTIDMECKREFCKQITVASGHVFLNCFEVVTSHRLFSHFLGYFFVIFAPNISCVYSQELSQQGAAKQGKLPLSLSCQTSS